MGLWYQLPHFNFKTLYPKKAQIKTRFPPATETYKNIYDIISTLKITNIASLKNKTDIIRKLHNFLAKEN